MASFNTFNTGMIFCIPPESISNLGINRSTYSHFLRIENKLRIVWQNANQAFQNKEKFPCEKYKKEWSDLTNEFSLFKKHFNFKVSGMWQDMASLQVALFTEDHKRKSMFIQGRDIFVRIGSPDKFDTGFFEWSLPKDFKKNLPKDFVFLSECEKDLDKDFIFSADQEEIMQKEITSSFMEFKEDFEYIYSNIAAIIKHIKHLIPHLSKIDDDMERKRAAMSISQNLLVQLQVNIWRLETKITLLEDFESKDILLGKLYITKMAMLEAKGIWSYVHEKCYSEPQLEKDQDETSSNEKKDIDEEKGASSKEKKKVLSINTSKNISIAHLESLPDATEDEEEELADPSTISRNHKKI